MIEARDSSVILAAEGVWRRLFAHTLLIRMTGLPGRKGRPPKDFFSVIGRSFWADAEYAADCHCCGALFNTPDWLYIKEIFICCCRRTVCCALLLEPFFKQALGRPNLCGICGKVDVQIIKIRKL